MYLTLLNALVFFSKNLRSWQGDSSTIRMYGTTPRDELHAEIMQNLLTKHDYKLATIRQWNIKLFPYMKSQRTFLFIDTSFISSLFYEKR